MVMTEEDLAAQDDGLVRIKVVRAGKRTSISMDALLFRALKQREGGLDNALMWVRDCMAGMDDRIRGGDPIVQVTGGTSRMLQRVLLHDLLLADDGPKRSAVEPPPAVREAPLSGAAPYLFSLGGKW